MYCKLPGAKATLLLFATENTPTYSVLTSNVMLSIVDISNSISVSLLHTFIMFWAESIVANRNKMSDKRPFLIL